MIDSLSATLLWLIWRLWVLWLLWLLWPKDLLASDFRIMMLLWRSSSSIRSVADIFRRFW
jgi:hypothetical protein